jgi:hypothetical protein
MNIYLRAVVYGHMEKCWIYPLRPNMALFVMLHVFFENAATIEH